MLIQQSSSPTLLARFLAVRSATMQFCAPLTPEDMMVQSCPEASPIKWHLAHTSWFFETFILNEFVAAYQPFHPDFRWLFNSYYKALGDMPEKRLRSSFSRPPLEQILAYREHVDAGITRLLEQGTEDEALRRITLGLEHEQQHLELAATDIKNAFFTNPLRPAYRERAFEPSAEVIAPPLEWLSFTPPGPGLVGIGITPDPNAIDGFAFDNETPRHPVYLAPFRLGARLVTCAEYLAFLDEDGYSRPELWLSEGWDTMRAHGWTAPLYWQRDPAAPFLGGASSRSTARDRSSRFPKHRSVTSVSLKRMPSQDGAVRACPRSSSGSLSPHNILSRERYSSPALCTRCHRLRSKTAASRSNSTAMRGNGLLRRTPAIPVTGRCPVRSGSTTASS